MSGPRSKGGFTQIGEPKEGELLKTGEGRVDSTGNSCGNDAWHK